MNRILWAGLFIFTVVGCEVHDTGVAAPAAKRSESKSSLSVAPDFTVSTIGGQPFKLSAFRGKVVIIDFWATWCGPCVYEIPGFIRLKEKYKDRGFEIIGLSVDRDRNDVIKFAKEKGINYPIAFADGELKAKYGGIQGIPTTFFIDRKGNLVDKVVGERDEVFFDKAIFKLLEEGGR